MSNPDVIKTSIETLRKNLRKPYFKDDPTTMAELDLLEGFLLDIHIIAQSIVRIADNTDAIPTK